MDGDNKQLEMVQLYKNLHPKIDSFALDFNEFIDLENDGLRRLNK